MSRFYQLAAVVVVGFGCYLCGCLVTEARMYKNVESSYFSGYKTGWVKGHRETLKRYAKGYYVIRD